MNKLDFHIQYNSITIVSLYKLKKKKKEKKKRKKKKNVVKVCNVFKQLNCYFVHIQESYIFKYILHITF